MDEKSTQVKGQNLQLIETLEETQGPSKKTLDFLKMFAHSYYVETSLPEDINATCLN